jgi:hypothetical protein
MVQVRNAVCVTAMEQMVFPWYDVIDTLIIIMHCFYKMCSMSAYWEIFSEIQGQIYSEFACDYLWYV